MSPKSAYDIKGRRKYLNRSEGQKFVARACQISRERALFCLILYYTGCRISEALALRSGDIETETCVILVRSLKKRAKFEIKRIPIPKCLAEEIHEKDRDENALIWRYSRTTAWRIVKEVMFDAEICGIHATAKGLRHAFGVRGALEKIPVSIIQHWMGHSDLSTTAIYLGVRDEEERQLIRKTWW